MMKGKPVLSFTIGMFIFAACHRLAPEPSGLAGDWTLLELNAQPAPAGAGGRRAMLRFETDQARVSGFAGCNRLTAGYTVTGDSLRIGPVAMTKMACTEGMGLEGRLADALSATARFKVSAGELVMLGDSGPLARFSRGAP